jgi:hypothetical protein
MRPAATRKRRSIVDFLLLKVNTNDTSLNNTCKSSRTVACFVLVPKLYFSSETEIKFNCHLVVLLDTVPNYHQEMPTFRSSVRVSIVVNNVPVTKSGLR